MLVLVVVGIALIVLGAVVLVWKPLLPGGTIKAKWFEVSSVGAGLPLIVLGVATIVIGVVDPFDRDGGEDDEPEATASPTYFNDHDGDTGQIWSEDGATYFKALLPGRRLIATAQVGNVDRFRVRGTYVSGATGYGMGLVCRREQADRYYLLSITSTGKGGQGLGRYAISKYENGEAKQPLLIPLSDSGVIDRRQNTLEARCEGEGPVTLTLLVNGTRVGAAVDTETPIARGGIGLRISTPTPPVTVRFDRFQLLD